MKTFSLRPLRSSFFVRPALVGLCAAVVLATRTPARAVSEPNALNGQKKSYGYSWQQEIQMGAEADKEITEEMGLYDNPELQRYVDTVGQRVLQTSTFTDPTTPEMYRNTKFTFRVLDSAVVNAFALPGGYVYVTRGLLAHLENEAQLAVVLGHEIGHVAARHSSQQARRSQWGQIGVIAGAILGQKVLGEKAPDLAPTLLNYGSQAMQTFLLRYSREAENEADTLGVSYATRAGYAAGESARFFQALQRLSATEGKALPTWQSTHPDPGNRATHVRQLSAAPTANGAARNVGEDELLRHLEGIVVGEDPREGFVQNGIFYHPALGFQLPVPAGWKTDNQRSAFVMADPSGQAMMGLRSAPGTRARDAAMQFASQSKIRVTASGDTTVNGLPTSVILGEATTEQGTLGVWNAFIEMDGKVFSLLGYAPSAQFEQLRSTCETVAAGFAPSRDQTLANVQPARLRLVRADRSAPFASFIPTSLPQSVTAESIAIMNQVALNEPVPGGRTLKVPDVQAPTPAASWNASRNNRSVSPRNRGEQTRTPPPTTPYPPQNNYPPATPNYPAQNYPGPNYPAQNYPAQTYPAPSPYPPSNYPAGTYPDPNTSRYPDQRGYPSNGYPAGSANTPSGPNFPQPPREGQPATYPQPPSQPNYPATSYPPYPQQSYPQPSQPTPPQGPVWPR